MPNYDVPTFAGDERQIRRLPNGKYETCFPWFRGFLQCGVYCRTWTQEKKNPRRVLWVSSFETTCEITNFDDLVQIGTTPRVGKRWRAEPGLIDDMNLEYILRSTFHGRGRFKALRESKYDIRVKVSSRYYDGSENVAFSAVVRTSVYGPSWFRAPSAVRKKAYSFSSVGSYYTKPPTTEKYREFTKRGRRSRRRRATIPRPQDSPPDLFWCICYMIWAGFDKCIENSQKKGRSYLDRIGILGFSVDEIVVVRSDL